MKYKIKYREISDNNYDVLINKIFSKIFDIRNEIQKDDFLIVSFDKDVKFINPLFFILLFDLHIEYEFTLIIDIKNMEENSQQYVHRLMTQYSDLEYFKIYSPNTRNKLNKDNYELINKNDEEQQFKIVISKNDKYIHLFTSVSHRKSLIKDTKYDYSMLPILKLRNFKLKEINTFIHEEDLSPYKQRRNFYNQLSLYQAKQDINQYKQNLQTKIEELLLALGLGERGLSSSFRDIFFELIDNIRKHTPEQSNAHISFRKDRMSNQYELIISDNSNKGFLNTYEETLEKEKQRLKDSRVKEELLQNYDDVIKDIKDKKYEKVLKGLFELSNKSNDEIHIHQIPRLAMHFGLPVLIKLLAKLSEKCGKSKPKLKLYLHNNDDFFEIVYKYENNKIDIKINLKSSYKKEGTYIVITFPTDVEISQDEQNNELKNINIQNSDYKLFLQKENRKEIQDKINKFTFCLDKDINEDLNESSKQYKPKNKCLVVKYIEDKNDTTFSEFLRNIYLYAYKYDLEDIVVVNVSLYDDKKSGSSENIEHIKLLSEIIYYDEDVMYEKSLNILFYSDRYPEAIIVGGKNKKEFIQLNWFLPKWGNNFDGILDNTLDEEKSYHISISDNLFINLKNKEYLIPFELFDIWDEDRRNNISFNSDSDTMSILQDMIEAYLNEVAKKDKLHIDTGSNYHIDRFLEFKKVFEDSRWVKKLAFRLAENFTDIENMAYYLIGMDKYTNMLISLCHTFLGLKDFKNFKYKLFNIYDDQDYEEIDKKINDIRNKNNIKDKKYQIYLISSVVTNGSNIKKLVKKHNIKAITTIHLSIDNNILEDITSVLTIKNNGTFEKITEEKYCSTCDTNRKIPLLEFSKNDPFFIKDTFFQPQEQKKIKS